MQASPPAATSTAPASAITPPPPSQRARRNQLASALFAAVLVALLLLFASLRAGTPLALWAGWVPASLGIGAGAFLFMTRKYRRRARLLRSPFPAAWREVLASRVAFYQGLDLAERRRFEQEVRVFLAEKPVTGIGTSLDDTTRVLVAASAVIPIFGFPDWEYDNLAEVLVYPASFDGDMQFEGGSERNILGLVHSGGALNRIMIISRPDLLRGFGNLADRQNVGIHEFAHLVDGADGQVDGIPAAACPECARPWVEAMRREMERLAAGDSVLSRYGLTNPAEFFAVATEAFFEAPRRLAERHPELYALLRRIFRQDTRSKLALTLREMIAPYPRRAGRNAPCPCGSGGKYRRCCGGAGGR